MYYLNIIFHFSIYLLIGSVTVGILSDIALKRYKVKRILKNKDLKLQGKPTNETTTFIDFILQKITLISAYTFIATLIVGLVALIMIYNNPHYPPYIGKQIAKEVEEENLKYKKNYTKEQMVVSCVQKVSNNKNIVTNENKYIALRECIKKLEIFE